MTTILVVLAVLVLGPLAIALVCLITYTITYTWCELIGAGRFMGRRVWRGLLP